MTPQETSQHNQKHLKKDMTEDEKTVLDTIRKIRSDTGDPSISEVCNRIGGEKAKWHGIIKHLGKQGELTIEKSAIHPNKMNIRITGDNNERIGSHR